MKNRFKVIEYTGHYSVLDTVSGKEHVMGDGVDALTTKTGRPMRCGTEHFRRTWERSLNENPAETAEAYGFPDKDDDAKCEHSADWIDVNGICGKCGRRGRA